MSVSKMPLRALLSSGSFRVMTLNTWNHDGVWAARRTVIKDGIQNLQPDFIAFQEVIRTDAYDQVSDLLGSGYHVFYQKGQSVDGVGAAIVSRWPFGAVREAELHVTARVDPAAGWIGSVTVAKILVPGPIGTVLFVHHKPTWQYGFERERELQAVAAAHFVEEVAGGRDIHVVLAGDFDVRPESASVRFWRGLQPLEGISACYEDAW